MCEASCALDAIRMVLDRCPQVERIEFVGCGPEETTFFEDLEGCQVEFEVDRNCSDGLKLRPGALSAYLASRYGTGLYDGSNVGRRSGRVLNVSGEIQGLRSSLWWESRTDSIEGIEAAIAKTAARIAETKRLEALADSLGRRAVESDSESESDEEEDFAGAGSEALSTADVVELPSGVRKVIVIQGETLRGLRYKWYNHLNARQKGLWEGHP
jgi:hypothetical protein